MTRHEMLNEYERGHRWRAAWQALASKIEPGRLQARQERIERRASLANVRVGRALRASDAEQKAASQPRTISTEVAAAIRTVLGTLPVGAEIRFYWHDGAQHYCVSLPGQPDQVGRLKRNGDGTGVIVPATLH
ncbi:hypothetical protein [Duganella vulcania]|uniref:Uncharacterized protein n=1 Tax=Duganella vulcania TaxID=2692166 RepID=A0A845GGU5_9BURK|nr:hypothetical protein [Duganella vulcania]MYM92486.1 hypothetical protein [Duganella vulcania]